MVRIEIKIVHCSATSEESVNFQQEYKIEEKVVSAIGSSTTSSDEGIFTQICYSTLYAGLIHYIPFSGHKI